MEKYSQEWWQTFVQNLESKFDYLLKSELGSKKYDIKKFSISDFSLRKGNKKIEEISYDIVLDYLGACDGNAQDISFMTQTVSDNIYDFFLNNKINSETLKFQKNSPGLVLEPVFMKMNFDLDTQHEYHVWVKVDYNE